MRDRQQSTTNHPMLIYMVLSIDHVTPAVGQTLTVRLNKDGAASSVAASGAVTEIDSANMPGWYSLAGNATDRDTLGSLGLLATATGCDPFPDEYTIVAFDPFDAVRLGLTALPNAAAQAAGGLYTRGNGAGQINQSANGQVDVNVERWLNTAVAAAVAGIPKVDLTYILGTILTEGAAGRLAAAFIKFFNKASPTGTVNSLPDAVPDTTGGLPLVGGSGGTVTADMTSIAGSTTAATNLRQGALSLNPATVVTGTLTITQFTTNLPGTSTDNYVGGTLTFTSNTTTTALRGTVREITAYSVTNNAITVSPPLDVAPVNGDTFTIA